MNKIYGIYDLKNKEQCITVGTLIEIKRFLGLSVRAFDNVMKKGMYQDRYEIIYIYDEEQEEMKEKISININLRNFPVRIY